MQSLLQHIAERFSIGSQSGLCDESMCGNGVSCSSNQHSLIPMNPGIGILEYVCTFGEEKKSIEGITWSFR